MKLAETRIFYTPPSMKDEPRHFTSAGQITFSSIHDCRDQEQHVYSTGACYGYVQKFDSKQSRIWIFNLAIHLIIRDGFDPMTVHNAFCNIREYRNGLALDVPMPKHLIDKFKKETAGESMWNGIW